MRSVMIIYGTRPEAIKLAPLIMEMQSHPGIDPTIVVTAQHRSMLDQVNNIFGIAPDHDLNIIQARQTLAQVTEHALSGLDPVIAAVKPEAVVVQGDTTTSFVAALAAFYHQVPVVHLEAGLRTHERYSPFPEEINRRLTSQIASLHLAPTWMSRRNLLEAGVSSRDVLVTGNTVIDALLWTVDRRPPFEDSRLDQFCRDDRPMLLVTAHRRESWGSGMAAIADALAAIAEAEPDLRIVFPLHRNPIVRETIEPAVRRFDNLLLTEPQPYGTFARLMERATLILTDSGGVQEEGPSLGKPVLVMRENTERPEAVWAGTAQLVGTDKERIFTQVRRLLHDDVAYAAMANAVNPYGDGRAARRSVEAIACLLGDGKPPEEFRPRVASGSDIVAASG